MNEASTEIIKTGSGASISARQIESVFAHSICLDRGELKLKGLLLVPYKIGECSSKKSRSKNNARIFFPSKSADSSRCSLGYSCKKINFDFMCRRVDANFKGTG